MAKARDFIHFLIDYGGAPRRARVTVAALLSKEGLKCGDLTHDDLIELFIKHHVQIEAVARSKIERGDISRDGATVSSEDLTPNAGRFGQLWPPGNGRNFRDEPTFTRLRIFALPAPRRNRHSLAAAYRFAILRSRHVERRQMAREMIRRSNLASRANSWNEVSRLHLGAAWASR